MNFSFEFIIYILFVVTMHNYLSQVHKLVVSLFIHIFGDCGIWKDHVK